MTGAIKNILILEPDVSCADRLQQALARMGAFSVSRVPTIKEACLYLMQFPQDLAFIPIVEGAKIMRSLRAVQPDLRLVLMTPKAEYEMPETYAGSVQAVLIKPLMEIELPAILENASDHPLFIPGEMAKETKKEIDALDTAVLIATLNQAHLGRLVHAVIFARGNKMLAYWGDLQEKEAAMVTIVAGKDWQDGGQKSRVQFMHLPARAGDMLLYSHQVMADYYLTLVALPETPVNELRSQAARMVVSLKKVVLGRTAPLYLPAIDGNGRFSFAIVWRPIQSLPTSLHIPLRRAIERLAATNACMLTHIRVQAEMVHLVVDCPPERDGTWAAFLFKNGSEQTIQQQYGVAASLWETGFYATESADPLSDAELNLFFERG